MNYLIGDSHLRFFKKQINLRRRNDPNITIFANHAQNYLHIDVIRDGDVVHGHCRQLANPAPMAMTLRAGDRIIMSGPLHSSLVARHKMWHRHAPWRMADVKRGTIPVSDNFFDALAQDRSQAVVAFLRAGQELGAHAAILEPPFLPERAVARCGLDRDLLITCDKAFRAAVRRYINAAGIEVIATPEKTHDGDFMLPDYQALSDDDMHHGNPEYSRIVVDDIFEFFDR